MAGGSLLALLDDITTILDDVATLTKGNEQCRDNQPTTPAKINIQLRS